jgi:hypothetical protein
MMMAMWRGPMAPGSAAGGCKLVQFNADHLGAAQQVDENHGAGFAVGRLEQAFQAMQGPSTKRTASPLEKKRGTSGVGALRKASTISGGTAAGRLPKVTNLLTPMVERMGDQLLVTLSSWINK